MSEELNAKIKKQGLNKGLILGIIMGVLKILLFYFMTTMATSLLGIIGGPILFTMIIPIVIAVLLCSDLRKNVGGFWDFRQAVSGIFVMFIVAYVVSYLLSDVLFPMVIEPDMVNKMEQAMIATMTNVMEKANADQATIDKALDDVHKQLDAQKNVSIGGRIQSFAIGLIFAFILALIFAAIFKKERPLYLTEDGLKEPTV
ncbi:DUF4199 domain-containing protein [Mucilaginibacter pedocola]|uniref:DUF4199 domain-containing protein n=1 Tax=Mucilaginibacter pedocola TaxID=1792845 RepID=A0A1S9PKV9_9SPHI|nr:DUF4199 domain-containing protein [Mucilaginibacter pedocola]OOQ61575.1 hypothetical protein BC343_00410 [Mucilaginibacter pedocola]